MTDKITTKQCVLIGTHEAHDWTLIGQRPDGTQSGRYHCEGDDADELCGDCVEGRCHWGSAGPLPGEECGCERHEASVKARGSQLA